MNGDLGGRLRVGSGRRCHSDVTIHCSSDKLFSQSTPRRPLLARALPAYYRVNPIAVPYSLLIAHYVNIQQRSNSKVYSNDPVEIT